MVDQRVEIVGATVDEPQQRLTLLQAEEQEQQFTDAHIQAMVDEIAELRKM